MKEHCRILPSRKRGLILHDNAKHVDFNFRDDILPSKSAAIRADALSHCAVQPVSNPEGINYNVQGEENITRRIS